MIAFDLLCTNGHLFECWFKDRASFEEQQSQGIINCPICNDTQVVRTYSPFMIKKAGGKKREEGDLYQALQVFQSYLEKHFEDVGPDFAKEALKIHYGGSEKKNIKGTTTPDEEITLKKEGVPFIKVPIIKRMLN